MNKWEKTLLISAFLALTLPASPALSSEMVEIPSGEFVMGDDNDSYSTPQHLMPLDSYWVDTYEVTNDEFAKQFPLHSFWKDSGSHPATDIT